MTGHTYSPEIIAWVRRTTTAQNLPEHLHPDTVIHRLGALLDTASAPNASPSVRSA